MAGHANVSRQLSQRQAHVHWAKRFILFLNMPHLNELGRISMSLARGQADSLTLPSGKEYNENQSHLS